jgi:hypothetical protein
VEHHLDSRPHFVDVGVEHAAVFRGQLFERQHVIGVSVGRWSERAKPLEHVVITPPECLMPDEIKLRAFGGARGDQRIHRDHGGHLLGMRVGVEQPQCRSPRMAEQDHVAAAERCAQIVDDAIEIRNVLSDCQPRDTALGVERSAGASLVKVGNDEVALEVAVKIAKERTFRAAGAAVQPDEQRCIRIGAANEEIEGCSGDIHVRRTVDRRRIRICRTRQ